MDWVRWAALDQAKAQLEALAAEAAPPPAIARPVTPPQDDMVPEPTTPTGPPKPLTSSTASAAEVEAMLPPGQPRKTPTGKRVALEMLGEEEDDEAAASDDSMEDVKNNHGVAASQRPIAPVTKASRTMSPHGKTVVKTATAVAGSPAKAVAARVAPATQARPVRVSPRIQGLANARKTGATTPAPTASGSAKTNGTNGSTSSTLPTLPARRAREEPAPSTRTRSGTSAANQRPTRPTPSKIPLEEAYASDVATPVAVRREWEWQGDANIGWAAVATADIGSEQTHDAGEEPDACGGAAHAEEPGAADCG